MSKTIKNILAICIGILPIYIIMIWYRLTHTDSFSSFEMLAYPLIFGGFSIILILILNKYLLRNGIRAFIPERGKFIMDIVFGITLAAICFLLLFIEQLVFSRVLTHGKPPSQEVIKMMTTLAHNPLLLAVWLGPVVWIGVAASEELARVFFLNCLWNISEKKFWIPVTIILVSIITGLVHFYQGSFGVVSIGIQGLLLAYFYYKFRRIWPLIISHAIFDSAQVILFVLQTFQT